MSNEVTDTLTMVVESVVLETLEEKKAEVRAKLEAQINDPTISWKIKFRDKIWLALLVTAGEELLSKLTEKLG